VKVNERIRTLEKDIDEQTLDEVLFLISRISGDGALRPTYFETLTVAAYEIFRRRAVDVAVVEAGIGGLWDATNVVDPVVSIVTNVAADHLEILGPTLEDVAKQKAGVFRPMRTAFTAAQGATRQTLEEEATQRGTRLAGVEPFHSVSGQKPVLPGFHQRVNFALAVAAVSEVVRLTPDNVEDAARSVRWPGRLQWVHRPAARPLLLDGAHNPDGAAVLAAYLDQENLSGKVDLVFGALLDKDIEGLFSPLRGRVRRTVFVSPPSPRAGAPEELAVRAGFGPQAAAPDLWSAIQRLEEAEPTGAAPIIVAGSLYLVGEMLRLLEDAPTKA
jgi:dihydrofolate synthase/folylpolyglutamate synthase